MQSYFRKATSPPDALVTKGQFTFGTFNGAVSRINPQEARSPMGIPLPWAVQSTRLKEWQAFQFGNERYFCVSAIYNAKAMGIVTLIVIDREKKKKHLFEQLLPPWKLQVGRDLMNGFSVSSGRGFHFFVHNHLATGRLYHTIVTEGREDTPPMSVRLEATHTGDSCTPISICQPFGPNRALYSHKALMPMTGTLALGDEVISFESVRSFMILDDHKGYYPFAMAYDWVTAAGVNDSGGLTGFNLTCNQVKDHHRYNENCLWENGRLHLLPPITVTRLEGTMGAWIIRDTHDRVNLRFYPEYDGRKDINALFIKVRYRAPFGVFEGSIVDDDGNHHNLDGYFGMGEDKYIRG